MTSASANDPCIVIPAEAAMTAILRLWDNSARSVSYGLRVFAVRELLINSLLVIPAHAGIQ